MITFIFHTEDPRVTGHNRGLVHVPLADQFCAMFGYRLECIHPAGVGYKAECPAHPSLEAAREAHQGETFIYMDKGGDTYLDEFDHPQDDAVYVVGHDEYGFGETPQGIRLKLRTVAPDARDWYAFPVLVTAMHSHANQWWPK